MGAEPARTKKKSHEQLPLESRKKSTFESRSAAATQYLITSLHLTSLHFTLRSLSLTYNRPHNIYIETATYVDYVSHRVIPDSFYRGRSILFIYIDYDYIYLFIPWYDIYLYYSEVLHGFGDDVHRLVHLLG